MTALLAPPGGSVQDYTTLVAQLPSLQLCVAEAVVLVTGRQFDIVPHQTTGGRCVRDRTTNFLPVTLLSA